MSRTVLYSKRVEAFQLLSIPAGMLAITFLVLLIAEGSYISCVVLAGGLIWLVPNLYFAAKIFSGDRAKITPELMLKNFYQAEVIKLTLCATLFIATVKFLSVAIVPLLIGFALAQVTFWISPILLNKVKRLIKE